MQSILLTLLVGFGPTWYLSLIYDCKARQDSIDLDYEKDDCDKKVKSSFDDEEKTISSEYHSSSSLNHSQLIESSHESELKPTLSLEQSSFCDSGVDIEIV